MEEVEGGGGEVSGSRAVVIMEWRLRLVLGI